MTDEFDYDETDTVPVLVRKMVWDILPCDEVEELMPALGLIAAGEDVAEMEHEESHDRLELLKPVINEVEIYTTIAADIYSNALVESVSEEVPAAHKAMLTEQNFMILRGGVIAVLAQLLDTGKLKYGDDVS